jgi:hypothetical protein
MSTGDRKPCPVCGEQIAITARKCRFCGEVFEPVESAEAPQGDATGGIIPYKNVPALAGYYLGVFSVIPCFPIGLAAMILGFKGLRMAKKHPEVKGKVHAWIGVLVGGFFGLLWLLVTGLVVLGATVGR